MKSDNQEKLHELALDCYNGACNPFGIINSLAEAVQPGLDWKNSLDLKVVIGQLSFLVGESLGPDVETLSQFRKENDL